MNKFLALSRVNSKFSSFDEHIQYLEDAIKENEGCIKDIKEDNENYKKEIEEVKALKKKAEENIETHVPHVYLNGWEDTDKKKQEVYEWCQAHEIIHHPEVVGNFYKECHRMPEHKHPEYEFITATSNTNVIRFVRCIDCYRKAIKEGYEGDSSKYELYLK